MPIIMTPIVLLIFFGMVVSGTALSEENQWGRSSISTNPVTARGLSEEVVGQDLVEAAIKYANILAVGESQFMLRASWVPKHNQQEGRAALVYLVKGERRSAGNAVGVPRDCTCVFVQMPILKQWIAANSTGSGRLELDPAYLLAFMFLHELGHLQHGHHATDFVEGKLMQLNIEPSIAKQHEKLADEFAAAIIQQAVHGSQAASATSLEATFLAAELTKLSWNLQARRSLDFFGSDVLGTPEVFFDSGYSHPNLSWRILRVNHLIHQTHESRTLLEKFEQSKIRGAEPEPLFKRRHEE